MGSKQNVSLSLIWFKVVWRAICDLPDRVTDGGKVGERQQGLEILQPGPLNVEQWHQGANHLVHLMTKQSTCYVV